VPIIIDNLNKLREGKNFPLVAQEKETSRYHTFPTRAEMDSFLQKGFHLVDPEYMRAFYLSNFSVEGTEHHRKLAVMIDKAIDEKIGSAFTRDVSQELFSTPSNE
jgi:hypothetical protein